MDDGLVICPHCGQPTARGVSECQRCDRPIQGKAGCGLLLLFLVLLLATGVLALLAWSRFDDDLLSGLCTNCGLSTYSSHSRNLLAGSVFTVLAVAGLVAAVIVWRRWVRKYR